MVDHWRLRRPANLMGLPPALRNGRSLSDRQWARLNAMFATADLTEKILAS